VVREAYAARRPVERACCVIAQEHIRRRSKFLATDTKLAELVLRLGERPTPKLRSYMRDVLLLIGVVLRSRIIPRKKWRAMPAIWRVIRLAWRAQREPRW
jgi:hypothetical protein